MKTLKILIPTDLSKASLFPIEKLTQLFSREQLDVTLLHVINTEDFHTYPLHLTQVKDLEDKIVKSCEDEIEQIREKINASVFKSNAQIVKGQDYKTIADYAKEHKVDFIAMSTHGRSGVSHMFLGSTAEKVVRFAPCPVMTFKTETT